MKRIVKDTMSDGKVRYRIERKWFFNLFWTTDMFYDAERDM